MTSVYWAASHNIIFLSCLFLFDLKPYVFLFSGVTWCGSMHVFGMWCENVSVFSLFIQHVLSSHVHHGLVTSGSIWSSLSGSGFMMPGLCLIVMKKPRSRFWKHLVSVLVFANLCSSCYIEWWRCWVSKQCWTPATRATCLPLLPFHYIYIPMWFVWFAILYLELVLPYSWSSTSADYLFIFPFMCSFFPALLCIIIRTLTYIFTLVPKSPQVCHLSMQQLSILLFA